jgi:hypothetical protein
MLSVAVIALASDRRRSQNAISEQIAVCHAVLSTLREAEEASEYQVEKLLEAVQTEVGRSPLEFEPE